MWAIHRKTAGALSNLETWNEWLSGSDCDLLSIPAACWHKEKLGAEELLIYLTLKIQEPVRWLLIWPSGHTATATGQTHHVNMTHCVMLRTKAACDHVFCWASLSLDCAICIWVLNIPGTAAGKMQTVHHYGSYFFQVSWLPFLITSQWKEKQSMHLGWKNEKSVALNKTAMHIF